MASQHGKVAALFAGQGAQKVGMAQELLVEAPAGTKLHQGFIAARNTLRENYGFDLGEVLQNVPSIKYSGKPLGSLGRAPEVKQSHFRQSKEGVLTMRTEFTQPAMLLTQWAYYTAFVEEVTKLPGRNAGDGFLPVATAGHSLGEFSALTAVNGLFPLEVALQLVHERGLAMNRHLDIQDHDESTQFRMYAISPTRAGLKEDDLFLFVEMLSSVLTGVGATLEIVNYNTKGEQYGVTGSLEALSALGKLCDPLFRANSFPNEEVPTEDWHARLVAVAVESVAGDVDESITTDPNKPVERMKVLNFIRRSKIVHPFLKRPMGLDDGYTLGPRWLEALTNIGAGRSGLKKKSYFVPIPNVSVPFHSSHLRKAMDDFYPMVLDALPSADVCAHKLGSGMPSWVTNLTGTAFNPNDKEFRMEALDSMESSNIGEQQHVGRLSPSCDLELLRQIKEGNTKELVAAILTAQLSHSVQWSDTMDTLLKPLDQKGCNVKTVIEMSPSPTLTEMFKRQKFPSPLTTPKTVVYPRDQGERIQAAFK